MADDFLGLCALGFTAEQQRLARAMGCESAEAAVTLLCGGGDDDFLASAGAAQPAPMTSEGRKLVLVVRADLHMGVGKVAAQCVHAALGVVGGGTVARNDIDIWQASGEKTIACKVATDTELSALVEAAVASGLPHYAVRDAGRTQVASGSRTVVAFGPACESRVDAVTGALRLL